MSAFVILDVLPISAWPVERPAEQHPHPCAATRL